MRVLHTDSSLIHLCLSDGVEITLPIDQAAAMSKELASLLAVLIDKPTAEERGGCDITAPNSDYTAALRDDIYRWFSKQQFAYTKLMVNQLAERLNSVVKAQQNCI